MITQFEISRHNLVSALHMAEFVATNRASRYELRLARESALAGRMDETRYRLFTAFDGDLLQTGARNVVRLLLETAPGMVSHA